MCYIEITHSYSFFNSVSELQIDTSHRDGTINYAAGGERDLRYLS